jgi:hypothetical protein
LKLATDDDALCPPCIVNNKIFLKCLEFFIVYLLLAIFYKEGNILERKGDDGFWWGECQT